MEEARREPGMIHVKAMGVITHQGNVLATRGFDETKHESFFRLIGGGMHFQEPSEDTLRRECKEELGTELENVSFLKVLESSFVYKGQPGHEIIFLFSADVVRKDLYEKTEIPIADSPSTIAVWVPIADVLSGAARLYPATDYRMLFKPEA